VITRALGTDPDVDVDTFSVEARPGDVFMLCSDGLTSMVDDRSILDIVEQHRSSLEQAARTLVDAANRGGGEDNITVVVFEIGDATIEEATTIPAAGAGPGDDETTLSGLEGVPPVDATMLLTRDELEAAVGPGHTGRRISRTAILVASSTAVALLAALLVWTLSRSYFVGTQPNGHVAVYQGFPWNIVGGVRLYRVRYESPVLAGELSQAERRGLFDHDLRSYGTALKAVKRYEAEVVP
jgi:PPM family protein phosphatase